MFLLSLLKGARKDGWGFYSAPRRCMRKSGMVTIRAGRMCLGRKLLAPSPCSQCPCGPQLLFSLLVYTGRLPLGDRKDVINIKFKSHWIRKQEDGRQPDEWHPGLILKPNYFYHCGNKHQADTQNASWWGASKCNIYKRLPVSAGICAYTLNSHHIFTCCMILYLTKNVC